MYDIINSNIFIYRNGAFIMEKYFKVKEHGSTVKVEILAGITTFMAMAYILMVNAGMFRLYQRYLIMRYISQQHYQQ